MSTDLIRLLIQYLLLCTVSLLKIPSQAQGDICACVTAAHVYHPPPQALSTERKLLARVQLCKSHLDVAFVINNLGAWLPPFLSLTPSVPPQAPSTLFHKLPKQPLICVSISVVS